MHKIKAPLIYPVDGPKINEGIIVVDDDGKILEIGSSKTISDDGAKNYSGAIIPGFINTHCHLELSHMKGKIDTGTGLIPFITSVVKFRDFEEEVIQNAIQAADQEMFVNGINAVGDICNKIDTATCKEESSIDYYSFVEMFDFIQPHLLEPTIGQYKEVYEKQSQGGRNKKSFVPHAPYSVSPSLFAFIAEQNQDGATVSIHNQENFAENQMFLEGKGDFFPFYESFGFSLDHFDVPGKTAIHYAIENMNANNKTLFVHNTMSTREDVMAAQTWNPASYWATCANANLYIENKLPDYRVFMDTNAKLTIGTDSLSSNWQLSVLDELKTIKKFNSFIPFETLLRWATLNGAEALSYQDRLGSLTKGKTPGILHLNAAIVDEHPDLDGAEVERLF